MSAAVGNGIVVQNHYYADEPHYGRVAELRRRANACRVELGLPPGRILRRVSGPTSSPWIVWQQDFADLAAWRADLDVLAGSDEFGVIRREQTAALSHFDRAAYQALDWSRR